MEVSICKYCGKEFEKTRKDKVFCRRECKQRHKDIRLRKGINKKRVPRDRRTGFPLTEKKSYCENCGFVAIHRCQLDIDHVDANPENNSPDNLRTLCANCHRLKTYINKDWTKKNLSTNH